MSISETAEKKKTIDKVLETSVLIYQAIAVITFIAIPILAFQWWQTPFIGAFVEHSMIFNGIGPTRESTEDNRWELFISEVELGDQLIAIDGQNVTSAGEIKESLSTYKVGDEIQIAYQQAEGGEVNKNIKLISFPEPDKFRYFYFPYFIGLIYLGISLWLTKLRLADSSGRAFILFSSSFSLGAAALFEIYTTHYLTILWFSSVALAGGALLDLALSFPREFNFTKKYPNARRVGYGIALALSLFALPSIYNIQAATDYIQKWQFIYGFTGSSILFFIGVLLYRGYTDKSPIAKQQIKMVWWGILLSFAPVGSWLFVSLFHPMNFSPYLLGTTIGFPIVTGYAILRYRLVKVDYIFSRSILVISLTIMAGVGYSLALWGIGLIAGETIPANNPFAIGIFVAVIALITRPAQDRFRAAIEKIRFRGKQTYQQQLQDFGQKITSAKDLVDITAALRETITESLMPNLMHLYVRDSSSNQYTAMEHKGKPTSDVRFTDNSPKSLKRICSFHGVARRWGSCE